MATKKYRPYFTLEELSYLSDSIKSRPSPPAELVRYLDRYILEISHGVRAANHTLALSMEESLGIDDGPSKSEKTSRILYEAYLAQASTFVSMSPAQISMVQDYRYRQGLMTEQEETDYEKSQGISV